MAKAASDAVPAPDNIDLGNGMLESGMTIGFLREQNFRETVPLVLHLHGGEQSPSKSWLMAEGECHAGGVLTCLAAESPSHHLYWFILVVRVPRSVV